MSLFPAIQPKVSQSGQLPLYREVAWDYGKNIPIWQNGNPVFITGAEAVKVWVWKALQVPRYQYEIYSWDYGNEWTELIGGAYSEAVQKSEAARYVRECLLVNPYITEVTNLKTEFAGDRLTVSCTVKTIYGEVTISV